MQRVSAADTTERETVVTKVTERVDGERFIRTSNGHYAAGDYYDTLIVRHADLMPIHEHIHYFQRKQDKVIDYAGDKLHQTDINGDSSHTFDKHYDSTVFGFGEIEMIIRAMPLRPGYAAILPLYSEGDDDIEHDSVTVLNAAPAAQWTVRFADPAIIATYGIDAASHKILSYEVSARPAKARKVYTQP